MNIIVLIINRLCAFNNTNIKDKTLIAEKNKQKETNICSIVLPIKLEYLLVKVAKINAVAIALKIININVFNFFSPIQISK
jgi:hypothetical protein